MNWIVTYSKDPRSHSTGGWGDGGELTKGNRLRSDGAVIPAGGTYQNKQLFRARGGR